MSINSTEARSQVLQLQYSERIGPPPKTDQLFGVSRIVPLFNLIRLAI